MGTGPEYPTGNYIVIVGAEDKHGQFASKADALAWVRKHAMKLMCEWQDGFDLGANESICDHYTILRVETTVHPIPKMTARLTLRTVKEMT